MKMHLIEDLVVEWMSTHQAGCGLMGEQGAESIQLLCMNSLCDKGSSTEAEKHNE